MEVIKRGKLLKKGYTTGTCALAAVKACCYTLFTGESIPFVSVTLGDIDLQLEVLNTEIKENSVKCGIKKYSGDDPDVTDGIVIYAEVIKNDKTEITGGEGIGIVTKDGLKVKKGNYAINPTPYNNIKSEIQKYDTPLKVIISAPMGTEIAKKTYNPRLGIEGGISILGTTGIVEPMSEKALVDTIKTHIDLLYRENPEQLLITVGNYAREYAKNTLNLDIDKGVKCSNFIGEALDYSVYKGFKKVLLVGHIGKMIKIAANVMNTHSSVADCRREILISHFALCGGSKKNMEKIKNSVTTTEAVKYIKEDNLYRETFKSIGKSIQHNLELRVGDNLDISFIAFGEEDTVTSSEIIKEVDKREENLFLFLAFTDKGIELAKSIIDKLNENCLIIKKQDIPRYFNKTNTFVFISSVGIATRIIAPFVKDKTQDSGVIVLDEKGENVIPVLSCHLGGANENAVRISKITGGRAIITTATDINNVLSIDIWAKNNNLFIKNPEMIKVVSGSLLRNKEVGFYSDVKIQNPFESTHTGAKVGVCVSSLIKKPFENTLNLIPKNIVIGIGCKKDIPFENVEELFLECTGNIFKESILFISSVCIKKDEPALIKLSEKYNIPFRVWDVDYLKNIEGDFTKSQFVQNLIGIDNVCERCASLEYSGKFLLRKTIKNGVTVSVFEREEI